MLYQPGTLNTNNHLRLADLQLPRPTKAQKENHENMGKNVVLIMIQPSTYAE